MWLYDFIDSILNTINHLSARRNYNNKDNHYKLR